MASACMVSSVPLFVFDRRDALRRSQSVATSFAHAPYMQHAVNTNLNRCL